MRRLVALLFVLVLPLQWFTATAAAYCPHEPESKQTQSHLGHHTHEHQASVAAMDRDSGDSGNSNPSNPNSVTDSDCANCHTHFVSAITNTGLTIPPLLSGPDTMAYQAFLPTPPSDPLFRPPLAPLA